MHLLKAWRSRYELVVAGVKRQDAENLACAQTDTDVDHPDEPIGEWREAQGDTLQPPGRLDAHNRKTCHPVDKRLRTRGLLDAQHLSEETEHPSNGTKTDPSPYKQLQSQPHQVDLVLHDKPLRLRLFLTQTILGLFEGLAGVVSLFSDPLEFFAQIPIVLCALLGFAFPLELFLNKIERSSTAPHRCQRHHPQNQLCDCGRHAPKCYSVSCRQWHAQ